MKNLLKVLLIFTILSLLSCGGIKKLDKKSEEVKTDIETKIELESKVITNEKVNENVNISTNTNTKVDDKGKVITKETTYEQKDVLKPGIIVESDGSKTILDNVKKTIKEESRENNIKTETTQKKDSIGTKNSDKSIIDENKTDISNTDKSSLNSNESHLNKKPTLLQTLLSNAYVVGLFCIIILAIIFIVRRYGGWIVGLFKK